MNAKAYALFRPKQVNKTTDTHLKHKIPGLDLGTVDPGMNGLWTDRGCSPESEGSLR